VGLSYRTTILRQRFTIGVRVQNLTDLQYWEGFQSRGAPRTTSVNVGTKF
jgi:outer membrane receptor protein involved in Fe transport